MRGILFKPRQRALVLQPYVVKVKTMMYPKCSGKYIFMYAQIYTFRFLFSLEFLVYPLTLYVSLSGCFYTYHMSFTTNLYSF